jgi:hypothetical protein
MLSLRKLCLTAAAAVLAGAILPAPTRASQALLGDGSNSGGWKASAPDGVNVSLQVLGTVGDQLVLKKTATFTDAPSNGLFTPIPIQFLKGTSGINSIVIDFEDVTNNTGQSWGSFNLTVLGTNTTFDKTSAQNWNGDAFTHNDVSGDNKSLTLSNGTVANGATFHPGLEAGSNGGNLVINANASFSLNETPGGGGNPQVPLPAAAWMGLSGLLGLGAVKQAKKLRRHA